MAEAPQVKVLVVDDETVARSRVQRLLASQTGIVVEVAEDGQSAVEKIRSWLPDIVFLDVQMPGFDGFEVVRTIGVGQMPLTIFVTAYEEHAARAFETEALDYLVKPYEDARFIAALQRARRRLGEGRLSELGAKFEALLALQRGIAADTPTEAPAFEPSSGRFERLVLRIGGRARLVKVDNVDWIEADGMYARVHSAGESHLVRIPMQELELRLDCAKFARVHRSAIVNLDRVKELREVGRGEWALVLTNGVRVKLSRSRRVMLEKRLGQPL